MLPASSAVSTAPAIPGSAETPFRARNKSIANRFHYMAPLVWACYLQPYALVAMNQFHYRQEDQFKEESNSRKLKELYKSQDFTGLLEFALLLNHEVSFNNSKVRWLIQEALEAHKYISVKHVEMSEEIIADLRKQGKMI